ncbi:2-amino-4-oxopentanoate thiolase subunit OrtA [Vagococcus fessus]|uniref:2-amino-4-ketopentanoate thiolase n=1 Tax=Vagococcus fessus TaxID=120370 RepID=A0A430AD27_9ENTE|nr:2-amino-4-oxopentanoate thiolase subunit OrtA [Vagococcus fessus]RSU05120.1 2-amino-4-ketopentanoate thiolase [Vagococcus fessus]
MFKKGEWVQVHSVVLTPEQRAPQVPDDTKKVPLEMWVKGFLLEDASKGDLVKVETVTNRIVEGTLVEARPTFTHSFGDFVPEILEIDKMLRSELFGGNE